MLKKYLKINETAFAGIVLLIIAVPLLTSYQNKKSAKEISQKQQTEVATTTQEKLYAEAPWRKEYEDAVDEYINSPIKAYEVLSAELLKKLQPFEVVTESIGDFDIFNENGSSIETTTNGHKLKFKNFKSIFTDGRYAEVTATKNGRVVAQKKFADPITDVIKVETQDTSYLIVQTFAGGAHCCIEIIPIVVSQSKTFIGENIIDAGDSGGSVYAPKDKPLIFLKNDRLYFISGDTRFSYFYTNYADSTSMLLQTVYSVNKTTGEIEDASSEFSGEYKKMISVLDTAMDKIQKYDKEKIQSVFKYHMSHEYIHLNPTLRFFADTKIKGNTASGLPKYENDLNFFSDNTETENYHFGELTKEALYLLNGSSISKLEDQDDIPLLPR